MKTTKILLTLAAVALSVVAAAKELTVTVRNVRSTDGSILTMLRIPGQQPLYAKTPAGADTVTVHFEGIEGDEAGVWIIHDENGNYQMDMRENGGPAEGYATRDCLLPDERNTVEIDLTYPESEQRRWGCHEWPGQRGRAGNRHLKPKGSHPPVRTPNGQKERTRGRAQNETRTLGRQDAPDFPIGGRPPANVRAATGTNSVVLAE